MEDGVPTLLGRILPVIAWALFLCLVFCLVGCSDVPVAEDLSQSQATEIVAVLNESGIGASASRGQAGRGKYKVEVSSSRYADAVVLLHRRGLPGEPRLSFDELVSQRGFLPNSREMEALRLDRAIAAEIEETVGNNPSVLTARVLVRSVAAEGTGPSASVSLRIKAGSSLDPSLVRQIVSGAIPGISAERIDIQLHEEQPTPGIAQAVGVVPSNSPAIVQVPLTNFLWVWRVPRDDYNGLALALLGALLSALALGAGLGFGLGLHKSNREGPRSEASPLRRGIPFKTGVVKRDTLGPGNRELGTDRSRDLPAPKS